MHRTENGDSAIIGNNNHAIAFGSDVRVIHGRNRITVPVGRPDDKWDKRRALEPFTNVNNHRGRYYTKNLPPSITFSPSNQMSKSRPTQSMCVFDTHFAPVCSE
jgi:hypothetical protein